MPSSIYDLIRISAYETYVDIRRDYARSLLGTLWNSIGIAVAIGVLGTFFGAILQSNLPSADVYIPYLAIGMIVWSFAATAMNRSCAIVRSRSHAMRHSLHPFPAIPLTAFFKAVVLFLQNIGILLLIHVMILGVPSTEMVALIAGGILVALNILWMSQLAALAAARFRDFAQLLSAALYLSFLVTPIIWMEHIVGRFEIVFNLNPAYHLLSLVRQPLLGTEISFISWYWSIGLFVTGLTATVVVYRSVRERIPYWL